MFSLVLVLSYLVFSSTFPLVPLGYNGIAKSFGFLSVIITCW
jgi:hypothetical protein